MSSARMLGTALAISLVALFPSSLTAQSSQNDVHQPHHYLLVDIGALGGPQSSLVDTGIPSGASLNNGGILAGFGDTSSPDPFPVYCFIDCYIDGAFQWRNGEITSLGVLPNGWSSAAVAVSANGLIAGFSQNGEIDPLNPGFPELRAVLWRNGVITDLGTLPEGGYESVANAVNSRRLSGPRLRTFPIPIPYLHSTTCSVSVRREPSCGKTA